MLVRSVSYIIPEDERRWSIMPAWDIASNRKDEHLNARSRRPIADGLSVAIMLAAAPQRGTFDISPVPDASVEKLAADIRDH